ncbi:MAG: TonB family protein [Nitrospirota bacterium]
MNEGIRYGAALASMAFGSSLVFGSLILMNELGGGPPAQSDARPSHFEVQKLVEPPKKKEVEAKPRRNEPSTWRPPAALDGLDSQLAGVDVGLPSLDLADMVRPSDRLLGSGDDLVMTDEAVDVKPRPTRRAALDYPMQARTKGIEGYVVLNVLITPSGDVEKVKVLESSPPQIFDQVAVDSVRQWQFEPAVYKGQPVRVWAKQKIGFDLS